MNKSLLPPNASALERSVEAAQAGRIDAIPVAELQRVWDVDNCPERLLPWLAWAMSVDEWDYRWPVEVRREVIRRSIDVHKRKGTAGAVKRALGALGVRVDLLEWFENSGKPFTFELTAKANQALTGGGVVLSPDFYRTLQRSVDAVKPERSHYTLRVGVEFNQALQLGGAIAGAQMYRKRLANKAVAVTRHAVLTLGGAISAVSVCRLRLAA